MRSKIMLLVFSLISLIACDIEPKNQPNHLIGEELKEVSSLTASGGQDQENIAMFDPTVNRVHQFNLATNTLVRSFKVRNPGVEHYVLYDQAGNYIVDLTKQGITIFDKNNEAIHDPITMFGKPISAVFRPDLGYLVIYDDLMSVGVIRLDANGRVLQAKVFGASFGSETIAAGDLDENGRLILALSDGSVSLINLATSLNTGVWTSSRVAVSLGNVRWLAPIRGSPDKILVVQNDKISMANLATVTVVDGPSILNRNVLFYGKSPDGHVIFRDSNDSALIKVAYAGGTSVTTKQIAFAPRYIISSRLDLTNDSWTLLGAQKGSYDWDLKKNIFTSRQMRRWSFASLAANFDQKMPDRANVEMNTNRAFALFPSKMGRATNYNLISNSARELLHFNVRFIE